MNLLLKIILASLLSVSFTHKKQSKLDGKYIMKFKNDYGLKNFTHIYFKNDSCAYYNDHFIMCKQLVSYGNHIAFQSCNQILTYDFDTTQLDKDTIKFQVHSINSGYASYLHISINSGTLIKIND